MMSRLTRQDFERLLEFRVTLRRFHRWSEDQAKAAGLTHVQHQLLVAIKGHPAGRPPTVGDLAALSGLYGMHRNSAAHLRS